MIRTCVGSVGACSAPSVEGLFCIRLNGCQCKIRCAIQFYRQDLVFSIGPLGFLHNFCQMVQTPSRTHPRNSRGASHPLWQEAFELPDARSGPVDRDGQHLREMFIFLSDSVSGCGETILELNMQAANTPNDYKWYKACSYSGKRETNVGRYQLARFSCDSSPAGGISTETLIRISIPSALFCIECIIRSPLGSLQAIPYDLELYLFISRTHGRAQ